MTTGWANTVLGLTTRREVLDAMRQGLSREESTHAHAFVLAFTGITLAILAAVYWRSRRAKTPRRKTRVDFLSLAVRAAGLEGQESRDVHAVARAAGLPHPAVMLLSPGNFAMAMRRAEKQGADPDRRRRLEALALKLFGQPLPARA